MFAFILAESFPQRETAFENSLGSQQRKIRTVCQRPLHRLPSNDRFRARGLKAASRLTTPVPATAVLAATEQADIAPKGGLPIPELLFLRSGPSAVQER